MAIAFKKETVLALIDAEITRRSSSSTEVDTIETDEQRWVDEQVVQWDRSAAATKLADSQGEHRTAEALRRVFEDAELAAGLSDRDLLKRVIEAIHDRTVNFNGEASVYIRVGGSEEFWLHARNRHILQITNQASYHVNARRRPAAEPKKAISLHEAREVVKLTTGDVLTMTDLKSLGVYQIVLDSVPKPAEAKPKKSSTKKTDDDVIEPEIVE